MAVETVTSYKCDRCGRSEVRDGITIMTLTVREHTTGNPGQGKAVITQHVCAQNCLKMIKAALAPVGRAGRPPKTATTTTTTSTSTTTNTKRGTKKPQTAVSGKIPAPDTQTVKGDPWASLPGHVRRVRMVTRTAQGAWAKGHNYRTERKLIEEAEAKLKIKNGSK